MESTDPPPTLERFLQAFLTEQISLLSQANFRPSFTWRAANSASDDGLSEDAIQYALSRARGVVAQHCRRVYTPQATRVLSERLENDYLDALSEELDDRTDGFFDFTDHGPTESISTDADLTNDVIVTALPKTWPIEHAQMAVLGDASRYAALVEQLSDLNHHRQLTQARTERLRRVKAMLRPFSVDQTQTGGAAGLETALQQNIMTRGCELERELERMKVLLARVGGRVSVLRTGERIPVGNLDGFDSSRGELDAINAVFDGI